MMQLKNLLFISILLLILYSCNNKDSVKIEVRITSTKSTIVYIEQLSFSKSTLLDSANISSGTDKVTFRVNDIKEPTFIVLNFKSKGAITLLAEANEKINIQINTDNFLNYKVEGSKGSLLTKDLALNLSKTKRKLDSLNKLYSLTKGEIAKQLLDQKFAAIVDSQRANNSRFIWANPMSRASVMALYQKFDEQSYVFDRSEDIILFKTVASSLKALYPNSEYTKGMLADISRMQSLLSSIKINNLIQQSESSIPDIALPNINGDTIKLSSLKGKVVLLDFWASWNQSSLLDNRELLNTYKQFRSKGFEIYQVSLDYNREEWVNAIESAGLTWINVSSLNPNGSIAARTYNITQIPANYLIGRDQSIIRKNLYGESLNKELRELLK